MVGPSTNSSACKWRIRTFMRISMGVILLALLYRERQRPRKLTLQTGQSSLNNPGTGSTRPLIVQKKMRVLEHDNRKTAHDVSSLTAAEPSVVKSKTSHSNTQDRTIRQPPTETKAKSQETANASREQRLQLQANLRLMKKMAEHQQLDGNENQQMENPGSNLTNQPASRQRLANADQQRAWEKIQRFVAQHANEVEQHNLPPLDTLIGDLDQNITGDAQWLLDFAIVGFGKCGTTTLIQWLDAHPQTNTIPNEALALSRNKPASLVKKLYEMKLATAMQNANSSASTKILQGFKNPSDIRRPKAMSYLRQYWPETKLIVTVRHPVHWFRSLYNYLLNEMKRSPKFLQRNSLVGGPHRDTAYAHTGKGEFHAILALLGKTNMTLPAELQLLQGYLRQDELENWPERLPNKIFFLETRQLNDENETRASLFRSDLQDFLGLTEPLPPTLHIRPGHHREVAEEVKMDICARHNSHVRKDLMRISRAASQWIREFFLKSPEVVVSSREYLEELFADWMDDPCGPVLDHTESEDDVERNLDGVHVG